MLNFGRNLKAALIARGATQEDLAEALGVTEGCVSHWVVGRAVPRLQVYAQIARLLGVPAGLLEEEEQCRQ